MARTPLFLWMRRMLQSSWSNPPAASLLQSGQMDPERRAFLKKSLGAAAAVAAVSLLQPTPWAQAKAPEALKPQTNHPPKPPVNIVGGGLGGLVTAYRLQQQGIPCVLYEGSQRLGGRVFTRDHFNGDGMFVELGGELIDTGHTDLIALCEELSVPLERFATDVKETVTPLEPALFYSQGKVFTEAQVLEAFRPLAQVMSEDLHRCFPDGAIAIPTAEQPYQAALFDHMSLAEYLDRQRQLAPVWLLRLIAAAYTGEYGLDPQEQSALNLLLLIGTDTSQGFQMFGESDEAMRVQGGNSRLVEAITRALQGRVPVRLGHRLTRLSVRNNQLVLGFSAGGQFRWEASPLTVLALPFATLRNVTGVEHIGLSPLTLRCIQEWGYGTNSKQMMGFHRRFWQNPSETASAAEHPTLAPASGGELFTDLPSQCYWDTSRLQPGQAGILTNFIGGQAGKTATPQQWQQALHDLNPLFGDLTDEQDGARAFFNWAHHPWAKGSYTCPRPGQYTALMGVTRQSELSGRLFFAGEHCSLNSAGYMNGAVESGNTTARQISENYHQTAVSPNPDRSDLAVTL